ncbi:MAG TPA: hypothetical protein PLP23_07690 [Panacibacter sp.]|nr:hypothetical protein [Panacibacter sp.]
MRKIASILLLCVLMFNWFGYQLLTSLMEQKANTNLEAQLDKNKFDESELISLKVAVVSLPYYNGSGKFERVDGHIEIHGVLYKYVERRLYNDSVELMCIPNRTAMQLRTAKGDFFKLVNDLQQNAPGKRSNSAPLPSKSFGGEYFTVSNFYFLNNPRFCVSQYGVYLITQPGNSFSSGIDQPPDFC